MKLEEAAEQLDDAALRAQPVVQLTKRMSLDPISGYRVQALLAERRFARGEKQSGVKMGFTSRAKARQMGVDEPICGRLTTGMELVPGERVSPGSFIHPRVEPEVVFLLSRALSPGEPPSQVVRAIDAVACGIELIDSRYVDFEFSLADVIADNASASRYLVGPWHRWPMDVGNLGVLLEMNGRVVEIGSTAAILGEPTRALIRAAELALELGTEVEAGWVMLAGAATAAVPMQPDSVVRAIIEGLDECSFGTEPSS